MPAQRVSPPASADQAQPQAALAPPGKQSIWRKIGGGSLSVSIIFHVLLLVLGAFWILRIIPQPEKTVDFMPNGGGGGSSAAPATNVKRQQALMPRPNLAKVVAAGATSAFTMPEMDPSSSIASIESTTTSGLSSGGLGGKGAGGGRGDGQGKGFGNGLGPGTAGGGMGNLFGMPDDRERMSGYIYDLTQLKDGKPSPYKELFRETNCEWQDPLVSELFKGKLQDSTLEKYYRGPEKLGVHQILIPCSKDITAPKAFGAEGKMNGGAWVIVYRGRVCAPESGEIRFCGTADNYLGVRFNNKNVLYYASGAFSKIQLSPTEAIPGLRMPIAKGDWMRVDKGRWYDMNIVIGDAGGVFSAVLYYERKGDAQKTKVLFRTQNIPWDEVLALDGKFYSAYLDLPKDLDPNSPVWQCKPAVSSAF
ncbi:hypothetical protein [Haloferula sp. BvORR071]|uniref:hypothetical protein n=1 Tax=Haloferula sp. BvORR071 TaxID=1396141 RepID=UPI000550C2F3|nr:hypothetical protein [Haloferula sp. BvORR071]